MTIEVNRPDYTIIDTPYGTNLGTDQYHPDDIFMDPKNNMIIDMRDPAYPVAHNPTTGASYPIADTIIFYNAGNDEVVSQAENGQIRISTGRGEVN